jgi:hypothetical protein
MCLSCMLRLKSSKAKVTYYRAVLPTSNPTHAAIGLYQEANHTVHGNAPTNFNRIKITVIQIFCSATLTPSQSYYFIHSSCDGGMLERGHIRLVQYCTFLLLDSTNHRNEILSTFPKSLSPSPFTYVLCNNDRREKEMKGGKDKKENSNNTKALGSCVCILTEALSWWLWVINRTTNLNERRVSLVFRRGAASL